MHRIRVVAGLALAALSVLALPACELPDICGSSARAAEADGDCVSLNHPPTTRILASPSSAVALSQRYTFEGVAVDPDGDQLFYEWDFDVRALLKFAKARWRSDLKVAGDAARGTLKSSGLVLAVTKGSRPRVLCLRVKARAKKGQPAAGTMRILGGTGPGATLRGSFTFRAVQDAKGVVLAVGEARPVVGKKRVLPKRCAALSRAR